MGKKKCVKCGNGMGFYFCKKCTQKMDILEYVESRINK